MRKGSIQTNEEFEYAYKFIILFTVFILIVVIPAFLLAPYIFHGISFFSLSEFSKITSFLSIFIGIWFLISAYYLKGKEKKTVIHILNESLGGEVTIFFVPYILYLGTKAMFKKMAIILRRNSIGE